MESALQDSTQLMVNDSVLTNAIRFSADSHQPLEGLFKNHLLPIQNDGNYLEILDPSNGFAFIVFLICIVVLIYLQRDSDNIFVAVFKASFDRNQAMQDARTENAQRTQNLFVLNILGFISIALFISGFVTISYEQSANLRDTFFMTLLAFFGFVLSKRSVVWFLANTFDLHQDWKVYAFNIDILRSAAGLALLPVTLFLFYNPQFPTAYFVYLGATIGMLFYLKGLHRGLSIAFNSAGVSLLHLFYYLCALEILPVFVLIRLVQNLQ